MVREIPIEFLKNLFSYCPLTGILSHKQGAGGAKAGDEAGSRTKQGYRAVKISWNGKRLQIMTHIVGWAIHYGVWPIGEVDHENTLRDNNWIGNLRDATRTQNLANRKKVGVLPKGVTFDKNKKSKPYKAQIKVGGGKNKYLGHFDCPNIAHQAYMTHAIFLHGDFARAS